MAFGARVLKTGIAVMLALYISQFMHASSPVIAGVAAIFAMQPSIYRSWRHFLEQLQTNTLGAALAMLAGMVLTNAPFSVGLVCILVIMICLKLRMEESIGLTLVTVIAVMEASAQWPYALDRFLLILVGISSAFVINVLFFPPRPKAQFTGQIHQVFAQMSLLLRTSISNEIKESVFRDEQQALEGSLKSLSDKYMLFEEELKKLKRGRYSRTRSLVIYKQMLNTLHKGAEVLKVVDDHYFQAPRTSEVDDYFDNHLERLTKFHEHVQLKFEDKLKPDSTESELWEEESERFMKEFMDRFAKQGDEGMYRLMIVATVIYDYGHQVARLDKLIEHGSRLPEEKELLDTLGLWRKG